MINDQHILLVEDDESIQELIEKFLINNSYIVSKVNNIEEAKKLINFFIFDLIILDVMLPEMNGFDICESIRLENSKVPILFLTAKSSNEDKLTGLRIADDYLTKPFNLKELMLRVQNLISRTQNEEESDKKNKLFIAGCNVDLKSFVIQNSEGDDFTLTHKQIKLLKLFIEKKDQVISRQEILEKVWGYDVYPSSRTIDNFILLFRKVFEKNLPSSTYFKSVRGVGYKFTP